MIALAAPMVRAEKVLFEWHDWGGMYGVDLLINSMYCLSLFSTHREHVTSIRPVYFLISNCKPIKIVFITLATQPDFTQQGS